MIHKKNLANYDLLKEHVTALFPEHPLVPEVSDSEQQSEINLLKESLGGQRFFFVVDLQRFELKELHGLQRWLGYPEKEFTLRQYWNIVHPAKQKPLIAVAMQLYDTLCTGRFTLRFLVQRYSSLVALRHYQGHYVLVKKISSVFQYDKDNRLTAYLNEFVLIGDYDGQPLAPVFFQSDGRPEAERGDVIMNAVMERFVRLKVYSPTEIQMARMLADEPGITQATMAVRLRVSTDTVATHSKRFLKKSRDFFHRDFTSAAEAARYLRKDGLI